MPPVSQIHSHLTSTKYGTDWINAFPFDFRLKLLESIRDYISEYHASTPDAGTAEQSASPSGDEPSADRRKVTGDITDRQTFKVPGHPEQVAYQGGGASTPTHAYDLIPRIALERIAARFKLGQERKGKKAWNAHSDQSVLDNKEWVIERTSHIINHALLLRDKIAADDVKALLADDDAAAIGWAACFFIAYVERFREKTPLDLPVTPERADEIVREAFTQQSTNPFFLFPPGGIPTEAETKVMREEFKKAYGGKPGTLTIEPEPYRDSSYNRKCATCPAPIHHSNQSLQCTQCVMDKIPMPRGIQGRPLCPKCGTEEGVHGGCSCGHLSPAKTSIADI